MGATGDRVNLAGTEPPARCDAGLAGPAGPGQRLTVTVQARRPHPDPTHDGDPVHHEQVVTDLVTRARNGQQQAWDTLGERYAPLIWSICRRHRLGRADADDVCQTVWLHLVDQLDTIRDPAALPGWLATTTRRECGRVLDTARGPHVSGHALDTEIMPDEQGAPGRAGTAGGRSSHGAARGAQPPAAIQPAADRPADRRPPLPYAQISARLGIPVGSIGPSRRRCLDKIRRHPAITALINAETSTA
jgi:RNA polymerase sigma factor (sigma-70 family)